MMSGKMSTAIGREAGLSGSREQPGWSLRAGGAGCARLSKHEHKQQIHRLTGEYNEGNQALY